MKRAFARLKAELAREKREMKDMPDLERKEIRIIYARKGFSGALLNSIVKKISLLRNDLSAFRRKGGLVGFVV